MGNILLSKALSYVQVVFLVFPNFIMKSVVFSQNFKKMAYNPFFLKNLLIFIQNLYIL